MYRREDWQGVHWILSGGKTEDFLAAAKVFLASVSFLLNRCLIVTFNIIFKLEGLWKRHRQQLILFAEIYYMRSGCIIVRHWPEMHLKSSFFSSSMHHECDGYLHLLMLTLLTFHTVIHLIFAVAGQEGQSSHIPRSCNTEGIFECVTCWQLLIAIRR